MTGPNLVDPRGLRFGAGLTTVVLAAVLLSIPSTFAVVVLSMQAVVFAIGAWLGLGAAPYGVLFRVLVRPRLGPPAELEEEAAPKFAQAVGFFFAFMGLMAMLVGLNTVAVVAVAMALAAAFLNAAFGFCLGCELYLLLRRSVVGAGGGQ